MSLHISFCLFGGGVGGEKCFLALCAQCCALALSDRDGWCLCVYPRVVHEMSGEKGSHRGSFHKRPSALRGLEYPSPWTQPAVPYMGWLAVITGG